MGGEAASVNLKKTPDGALIVSKPSDLAQAVRSAPLNATIQVPTETLMELGERAAGSGRLNRPDIKFRVGEAAASRAGFPSSREMMPDHWDVEQGKEVQPDPEDLIVLDLRRESIPKSQP